MSDPILERLGALDSCAVSDALDRLKLSGVAVGLRALSGDRRIRGRAVTVALGPADDTPSPRHLCTAAIDASGPGAVIVIAHNGRTDVAGWGGILSYGAVSRQAEGVVIDGACRDLDESRAYGLAIYGLAAVPVSARTRIVERDWNCPVVIGGVAVAPGDLVLADGSGVVFVPQQRAREVVALAEDIARREAAMTEAIRSGAPMTTVMGRSYETMTQPGDG